MRIGWLYRFTLMVLLLMSVGYGAGFMSQSSAEAQAGPFEGPYWVLIAPIGMTPMDLARACATFRGSAGSTATVRLILTGTDMDAPNLGKATPSMALNDTDRIALATDQTICIDADPTSTVAAGRVEVGLRVRVVNAPRAGQIVASLQGIDRSTGRTFISGGGYDVTSDVVPLTR